MNRPKWWPTNPYPADCIGQLSWAWETATDYILAAYAAHTADVGESAVQSLKLLESEVQLLRAHNSELEAKADEYDRWRVDCDREELMLELKAFQERTGNLEKENDALLKENKRLRGKADLSKKDIDAIVAIIRGDDGLCFPGIGGKNLDRPI